MGWGRCVKLCDTHVSLHIQPLQSPLVNDGLLCPIDQVLLNYTVVYLDQLVDTVNLLLQPRLRDYSIPAIRPGTTYSIAVSFVNEVGESVGNPISKSLKISV